MQTCKIFGCSEISLIRWVYKYKSTNNITQKKRDYTSYKISNSHISFIKQLLKDYKTITIDELLHRPKRKMRQNASKKRNKIPANYLLSAVIEWLFLLTSL